MPRRVPAATSRRVSSRSSRLGRGVAAGVDMCEDEGGGVAEHRGLEHLAGMHEGAVEGATTDFVEREDAMFRGEQHDREHLGGLVAEHAHQEIGRRARGREGLAEQDGLARLIVLDRIADSQFAKSRSRVRHRRVLLCVRVACSFATEEPTRAHEDTRATRRGDGLNGSAAGVPGVRLARARPCGPLRPDPWEPHRAAEQTECRRDSVKRPASSQDERG